MNALILALLLAGTPVKPCLTRPPPMPDDHAAECLAIPENRPNARMACALDKINEYIRLSVAWQKEAWRKCGPPRE